MSTYVLQTERLALRELYPSDAQFFYDLNSDPEVIRWTGDPPFESVEAAREFLEAYPDFRNHGYGRWAVERKADGEVIGWCGLKNHEEEGFVDLGFRFFRREWGKGYATEAAKACIDYGFLYLDLQSIIGRAASENKASIRVLQKCGMRLFGFDTCHGIENAMIFRIDRK